MSLPAAWVDRIFDKLALTYGRDFIGRYEGMDFNAVKSNWAFELAGFVTHPSAIAHVLANLPDRPPSVIEFRKIARAAPLPDLPRIEYSSAGKERVAAELAKLAPFLGRRPVSSAGNKDWAHRIIENDRNGIRPKSSLTLKMARAALAERTLFTPVQDEGSAA